MHYKDLLDIYIQPFLLYQVLSEIIIPVSYKMSNFGLMRADDEKDYAVNNGEVNLVREYYTNKGFSGPNRGKYWLERMKADHKKDILKGLMEK